MAAALLRRRLAEREIPDVVVSSAGLLPGGVPATEDARRTVDGLDEHRSRRLTFELVRDADLVIAMARRHLREAATLDEAAIGRTFTLRELVRCATEAGPRRSDEPFDAWLARIGAGRRAADHLVDDASDDIADPIGQPLAAYQATAVELDELLHRFAAAAWP